MFLTPEQLQDLTGYERGADQARWLRARQWIFELNAQRRPKVLRAYAEARLGLNVVQAAQLVTEPNFDALRG